MGLLCFVYLPLRPFDHTFGGVLSDVCVFVCLFVCDLETSKIRLPKSDLSCCATQKENIFLDVVHPRCVGVTLGA